MTRTLIAGNWKMNGEISMANELASAVAREGRSNSCEYLICPPFTALSAVAKALRDTDVSIGGQDCHAAPSGAHTGDISVGMLNDIGCTYVILGHSERRSNYGETNELVKAKAEAAIAGGLKAIVCVGETEAERDSGEALTVVGKKVAESIPAGATSLNTVISYEPVWAIGTGRVPTVEQISEMHLHIKEILAAQNDGDLVFTRILYGGSVGVDNARIILAAEGVGGALIGGASLKAESFLAIGQSCP